MKNKTKLTIERRGNSWAIYDPLYSEIPVVHVDALTLACDFVGRERLVGLVLSVHGLDEETYRKLNKGQLAILGVGTSGKSGRSSMRAPRHGLLYLSQDGSITSA